MYQGRQILAVIVAAGTGSRMKADVPKQFLKIGGKTIIENTVSKFDENRYIDGFFVVVGSDYLDYAKMLMCGTEKLIEIVAGGRTRQESVFNALQKIEGNPIVLIHDGARPYVSDDIIEAVVHGAYNFGAAVPAMEVSDTIKSSVCLDGENTFVKASMDRSMLRSVQTPQGFEFELLKSAHVNAKEMAIQATDDATLVEAMGEPVCIVPGESQNIKITRKEDMPGEMRIGTGFDVHRLGEKLPLYLGGEKIPYEKGLLGHSDADVLTHAIIDALLGAAKLGDIGRHFPDTSPEYKDISSVKLLTRVGEMLRECGYRVVNIDATVMCEKPKLASFIDGMEKNIACALVIEKEQVNIKATTTEGLGYTGREEGIAASAVCLLGSIYK